MSQFKVLYYLFYYRRTQRSCLILNLCNILLIKKLLIVLLVLIVTSYTDMNIHVDSPQLFIIMDNSIRCLKHNIQSACTVVTYFVTACSCNRQRRNTITSTLLHTSVTQKQHFFASHNRIELLK